MTEKTALADIVDLDRYPIDRLRSPEGIDLVARCRSELVESSVCQLDEFLRPAVIAAALAAVDELMGRAWASDQAHNAWFEPVPTDPKVDDPLGMLQHSAKHAVAYDLLPSELALRTLYESQEMTDFIAAALGADVLYRSADPLDALELAVFTPGQELGWHFDNSEFSVTLMLQSAEDGGSFEYLPALRTADDPNRSGVARFLGGEAPTRPIRLEPRPGTLSLFAGRLALHRITPVEGERPRVNAVLTYGEEPGMQLTDLTRELFYGRLR